MSHSNYRETYLICLDKGDDVNFVVARTTCPDQAQELAQQANRHWIEDVYITVERAPLKNPLEQKTRKPKDSCICGESYGRCIGDLSCKCGPLATCKRSDKSDIDYTDSWCQEKRALPALEDATLVVVSAKRGLVEVRIPEWRAEENFGLSPDEVPTELRDNIYSGSKLDIKTNLDAEEAEDLIIKFNPRKASTTFDLLAGLEELDDDPDDEED